MVGTAPAADLDRHRQVLLRYAESRLAPGLVAADAAFRSTTSPTPPSRKAVSRLPRSAGLEVEPLAAAEESLERPVVDRPSCLVLDVRMPGSSGPEIQAALQDARRDVPMVLITGHGDLPTGVRATKGGAVDFPEKPSREDALLGAIHQALERRGTQVMNAITAAPRAPGGNA
jgi:FixJ family two-component response regulator